MWLYLFIYSLVQQRVYQSRVHDVEEQPYRHEIRRPNPFINLFESGSLPDTWYTTFENLTMMRRRNDTIDVTLHYKRLVTNCT